MTESEPRDFTSDDRMAAHERFVAAQEHSGSDYTSITGEYVNDRLVLGCLDEGLDVPGGEEVLDGIEAFIARHIAGLLGEATERPVIAQDIGGGVGVSWLKLSAYFAEPIAAGRLALVVSNLTEGPERYLQRNYPRWYLTQNAWQRIYDLYETYGDRVHYIEDDFMPTANPAVALPNGRELALRCHTDLAHEHLSLTNWSKIPEIHILEVGRRLSRRGIYLTDRTTTRYGFDKDTEDEARLRGIIAARQALEKVYGLQKVTAVEAGSFAGEMLARLIFKGSEAPPITV
ncbi:MAG TPA: hypothetical protein VJ836_03685 [Candidatus Saccharimonadales bacterium]|nr:hypothetical protein [Candidatus Saccharimonadales bacterium]